MADVIDHLYRKAIKQDDRVYAEIWDKRYEAIKKSGAVGFVDAVGGPNGSATEALRNILSRMAADIAELQKGRP